MTTTERRVVLVKPGDVLLIGNVAPGQTAELDPRALLKVGAVLGALGVVAVMFEGDITIDSLEPAAIRELAAQLPPDPVEQPTPAPAPSAASPQVNVEEHPATFTAQPTPQEIP